MDSRVLHRSLLWRDEGLNEVSIIREYGGWVRLESVLTEGVCVYMWVDRYVTGVLGVRLLGHQSTLVAPCNHSAYMEQAAITLACVCDCVD